MANANFVLLEKITVGAAGASSVTFSGIPQTGYTDLVVKVCARVTRAVTASTIVMVFNGVTSGYTDRTAQGDGASATSSSSSGADIRDMVVPANNATASTFSNQEIYIPNYASSTTYKSVSIDSVMENNATTSYANLTAGLWSNNAAITSIAFSEPNGGSNFAANSTFYLYGVAKLGTTPAIVPYATGGDTIMTDGTYWYHAFKASGTFTPTQSITAAMLTIAGGGGAGVWCGGGGGAGGLIASTSQSLTAQAYTITVGAGGAGSTAGANRGTVGNNSTIVASGFTTITATGGGGGGSRTSATGGATTGSDGGSGGGGNRYTAGGAASPSGQGNAGGAGTGAGDEGGGGGGGAGAVGATATNAGGNGGVGLSTYSSWGSATSTGQNVGGTYFYAGGGGGGVTWYSGGGNVAGLGGNGGGGNGTGNTDNGNGYSGTANTGGGGGGGTWLYPAATFTNGGSGGSGLTIVRYLV